MSRISIKSKFHISYTQIPNYFIDHFLADANDIQIKVYLFLLRYFSQNKSVSIPIMADFFNYPETDILRALLYWEKKKLLSLSFDEYKNITEILLVDLASCAPDKKEYKKPDYSLEQLEKFQARDSSLEIVFIAESYLGRTLSPSDIRSIVFISEELHFSVDMIDHLLQYCIDRGKKEFRYIEKVALNWAENHITTPQEAQSFSSRYHKDVYTVMNALGKNSAPTPKEAEFIKRWYQIYGFTSDIVLEACERTVMATDRHRFEYADKILSNWKKAGVHHKPDIAKIDSAHNYKNKNVLLSPVGVKNKFNQFQQNEYDFDQLEKELISN